MGSPSALVRPLLCSLLAADAAGRLAMRVVGAVAPARVAGCAAAVCSWSLCTLLVTREARAGRGTSFLVRLWWLIPTPLLIGGEVYFEVSQREDWSLSDTGVAGYAAWLRLASIAPALGLAVLALFEPERVARAPSMPLGASLLVRLLAQRA